MTQLIEGCDNNSLLQTTLDETLHSREQGQSTVIALQLSQGIPAMLRDADVSIKVAHLAPGIRGWDVKFNSG